jgi:hypothetical protein
MWAQFSECGLYLVFRPENGGLYIWGSVYKPSPRCYQGLPVVVVPILQVDGETVIQERIHGLDSLAAILRKTGTDEKPNISSLSIFRNGFVDHPQAAIKRVAGLVFGLRALHWAGKVQHHLKLENIMIEEREHNPDELRA